MTKGKMAWANQNISIQKIGINKLKELKLEKSIKWQIAFVKKVNQFDALIELKDNSKELDIKIYPGLKEFKDLIKRGDLFMLKM